MSETISAEQAERQLMGRVVKQLRTRLGLTQEQCGERLGISAQAWQRYEAGGRHFTPSLIGRLGVALGVDPEEFQLERARLLEAPSMSAVSATSRSVSDRGAGGLSIPVWGRVRASDRGHQVYDTGEPEQVIETSSLFGPGAGALRLAGESMIPWAEPGDLVIFDRNRHPRRGHGCVIETLNGEYYVKLYQSNAGGTLMVKEIYPEEKVINFATAEIKGYYAVRLRGD
ncbi:LexA family transcriptional regulator [Caulobacter sp. S45]|uniref:XRE family transcriptional regulator n=1 Tax=Caulobacter sp. S45 TaxID=1641861 RepID=UPI0015775DB3|nr:LexA family transcriptional regulator [Caulobacter sp. S45]